MPAISSIARRFARLSILASHRIEKAATGVMNKVSSSSRQLMNAASRQAGEHLQRLADQLAEQRIQPLGHLTHVVGEAAHQVGRAVFAEGGQVHPQGAAIEHLSQIERGQLRQTRRQHVVGHQEEVFHHRSQQQEDGDEHERSKGSAGR